jgi:peptide deformylase
MVSDWWLETVKDKKMALLEILRFPDKRLRTKAKPVEQVDKEVQQIIDDMYETMYDAPGIGLAATQVNIHRQIIVMDLSEEKDQPLCLINPKILYSEGMEKTEEGCLSVPTYYAKVQRAEKVTVQALDQQGEPFELEADELLAVCIQHEIDHLQGKLFIDYLSPLKQHRLLKKIEKVAKQNTS